MFQMWPKSIYDARTYAQVERNACPVMFDITRKSQTMEPRCRPRGKGGMHHCTFKATARREGSLREDWNELLADPLNRAIAVKWDRVLNSLLPARIGQLSSRLLATSSKLKLVDTLANKSVYVPTEMERAMKQIRCDVVMAGGVQTKKVVVVAAFVT